MKKKLYTGKLDFSAAELRGGIIGLNAVGIQMPRFSGTKEQHGYQSTKDWLAFGWMGNDPKYDASVKVNELAPKREDFIEQPFRLLSATTVGAGTWKAADFSQAGVLKASTMMLEGITVYKDHETDTDNWVGLVTAVKWSEGFTDSSGQQIPAGIDGIIAVDAKTNPKTARGVLGGMLYSNSVSVEFEYEMSHHFENEWDFFERVGTIGADGKMIRRLVKNIVNYHETSLVWLGADPFAKAHTGDDGLKRIDVGSVYTYAKSHTKETTHNHVSITEEPEAIREIAKNEKKLVINFALDEKILSLAKQDTPKNEPVMNKFLIAFVATFGKELGLADNANPTDDEAIALLSKVTFNKPEFASLEANNTLLTALTAKALPAFQAADEKNKEATTVDLAKFIEDFAFVPAEKLTSLEAQSTEIQSLTQTKTDLETQVSTLTAEAALGKEYIGMKRNEAIRLYKAAVGEADASVISLFEKADAPAVDGLLKQYTKSAAVKFSGKCSKCGETDIEFRSSFSASGDDKPAPAAAPVEASGSYEDIYDRYSKTSTIIGRKDQDKGDEE